MVIFLDAKEVINASKGDKDWKILSIILDILKTLKTFVNVEFSFIPRALNGAAHFSYDRDGDFAWFRSFLACFLRK